ncbi:hypothetical protein [Paenibacillus macerans]|uniref:hypothetical protein n=1 Tax=Paenibacillus macerans TaxID=44252 RepID=UPI003D323521
MRMNEYLIGIAQVTSRGVFFRGIYYSTSQAIKESWFEIANRSGDWPVAVLFDPETLNRIYIVDEKKNNNLIECESIKSKSEYADYKEKLEEYFQRFQKLQGERSSEIKLK